MNQYPHLLCPLAKGFEIRQVSTFSVCGNIEVPGTSLEEVARYCLSPAQLGPERRTAFSRSYQAFDDFNLDSGAFHCGLLTQKHESLEVLKGGQ